MADSSKDANNSGLAGMDIPSPLLPLVGGIRRSFASAEHSDLTIICKERQWKVHKVLLCAQSEWFQKSCAGPFKEAENNEIKLDDDDPQVIDAMLHYLYNFHYGDYGNSQEHVSPLVLDVRMFAVGDKHFIAPLKKLAAEKFTTRAEVEWEGDQFAAAISEIYSIVPEHEDALVRTVICIAQMHAAELFDTKKGYDCFRMVAREVAAFGADVAQALAPSQPEKMYRCGKCSFEFAKARPDDKSFDCPRSCYAARYSESWWADKVVKS